MLMLLFSLDALRAYTRSGCAFGAQVELFTFQYNMYASPSISAREGTWGLTLLSSIEFDSIDTQLWHPSHGIIRNSGSSPCQHSSASRD